MNPTEEQQVALDLFGSGAGLAIEAGAGTGKTTTLTMLAGSTKRRGTYVAFNRAIVQEAKRKMPSTVRASTAHGLAMGAVGRRFEHRLQSERMRSDEVAKLLGLEYLVVDKFDGTKKVMQRGHLASLVQRAIANFCFSADDAPAEHHVPWVEGIDPADRSSREANRAVRHHIGPALDKAWADLSIETGQLRFGHDHYLKIWQLSRPRIPGEFVLFDEAQDAAPVMLAAVQSQEGKQLVYVGDSQQQIYEWRGAINALDNVGADAVAYLSESFRFGPSLATLANRVLAILESPLRLTGRGGPTEVTTTPCEPDAILTRSNAEAVTQVLQLQRDGARPHLVGGGEEVVRFAKAAAELMAGLGTYHPELVCFDSWGEVKAYVSDDPMGGELKLMVDLIEEFGVPTIVAALEEKMPAEADADVAVSTAHKAKGREWDRVQLAGDFAPPEDNDGEWRLLYVAATRARHVLDVGACDPLRDLMPVDAHARMAAAFPVSA